MSDDKEIDYLRMRDEWEVERRKLMQDDWWTRRRNGSYPPTHTRCSVPCSICDQRTEFTVNAKQNITPPPGMTFICQDCIKSLKELISPGGVIRSLKDDIPNDDGTKST